MVQKTKKLLTNKKITSVLVAIADEKYGSALIDFVINYRWTSGTHLRLLYVLEEHAIRNVLRFSPQLAEQIVENDEEYGQDLLALYEKQLKKSLPNTKIEPRLVYGSAKEEILKNAKEINADFIILGAHGRTGLTSLLLGSVSLAVTTHANCSVLIVRTTK